MLSIPQLPSASTKPAQGAESDATASGDGFAALLGQLGLGGQLGEVKVPSALLKQAMSELQQGLPLDEVLANLRQALEELAEGSVPPGFLPSQFEQLDAAPADDIPEQPLLARLGIRETGGGKETGRGVEAGKLAEAVAKLPAGEAEAGPEVFDLPESVLGKDRHALASRFRPMEAGLTPGPVQQAAQAGPLAPLRALELPPAFSNLASPLAESKGTAESLIVPNRVGEAGWGQAVAQRVMWMIGREQQTAELKLNPAHLGPMEIKLTLHQDQASVSLLASNSAVKEALEQALPRLRDMMGQQDIQLVQVDVGQRHDARNGAASGGLNGQGGHAQQAGQEVTRDTGEGDENGHGGTVAARGLGLLDAYA